MLSRFISSFRHKTHILNPKTLTHPYFFSINNGKHGSWPKEEEKSWSFHVEIEEEQVFDVGEEVKVGMEIKGFELEKKFQDKDIKGDYKTMFSLLKEFKAEQTCLTDKAFGFLTVCGLCKDSLMNLTKKVVDMLNEVGGSCCGSGIYGLIEMFCCLDLFEMATFVIEITERTASRYNILIRKKCQAGQIEKARAIIKEMSEFGCSPNIKSYNYVLGSLCKNDKVEDVRIVLEEMRNKGLNPDAITFETLVYHSSRRGQIDFASKFLNLMVNLNVEPRSTTHAAFLKALLEAGERQKAYKYVIDMSAKYNHCRNTLYSLLVRLNQEKGDIMAAQKILNEMVDKDLKPDFGIFINIVKQLQKTSMKTLAQDLRMKYSVFYCSNKANNSLSNSFGPCQG